MAFPCATVAPFAALDGLVHGFGLRVKGAGTSREAARRRVAEALASRGRVLFLTQVHGAAVAHAPWDGVPAADAAVAEQAGLLLAIETADCLPALFVDPVRRAVAAAHAGWRGTAAGVARKALQALLAAGSRLEDVRVALGPAIGVCCYEVGDEVRAALGPALAPCFRTGSPRPFLDLRAANRLQLEATGLPATAITDLDECTRCLPERYHSWRRDGATAGRMIHVVGYGLPGMRG